MYAKKIPPMPNVEQPPSWSVESTSILKNSAWKAYEVLYEEAGLPSAKEAGLAIFGIENEFHDRCWKGDLKVEFYHRALHFISSAKPTEHGRYNYGLPVDRAHARLHLWLQLFD
jgi:hypothetical protein